MTNYHSITVTFTMRDCKNSVEALRQMISLLPHHPDETTAHMESWSVDAILRDGITIADRRDAVNERGIEGLVAFAEGKGA